MIELVNLEKVYGDQVALSIESLQIRQGELVGLVGNNGAGKTTMLSLILDLIKPSRGFVKSKSVKVSATDQWKLYTGSYLNESFLIPFLTPIEFLEFIGNLHDKSKPEVHAFLNKNRNFFNPDSATGKYIRELSSGNKNKLGILAALLSEPEILILDEPFSNLDPSSQAWLKTKLTELHNLGATILISSHDLRHVTEICTRIVLLEDGLVAKDIPTNEKTLIELEDYFNV